MREKSDELQEYLKKYSKKKDLFGGIVANTDPKGFKGRWMMYASKGTDLASGDFSNWEVLEI